MVAYSFSNVTVRPFPMIADLNNPWIFGGVQVIINVSGHDYPEEIRKTIQLRKVESYWFPLVEEGPNMGLDNIIKAVKILFKCDEESKKVVLHCDGGNNRSRVVAELFHYLKMGFLPDDEYKGYRNHVEYNIATGHLPANTLEVITSLPGYPGLSDPDDH